MERTGEEVGFLTGVSYGWGLSSCDVDGMVMSLRLCGVSLLLFSKSSCFEAWLGGS